MKFEVIVIPVADVDRSKAFYTKLGWRLDADFPFDNGLRAGILQFGVSGPQTTGGYMLRRQK